MKTRTSLSILVSLPLILLGAVQGLSGGALKTNTWPCGVVPYQLDASMQDPQKRVFLDAAHIWEQVAQVKFIPQTTESIYITVFHDGSLRSEGHATIGYEKGGVLANFTAANLGAVTHELGHVLGFIHEHQRPKRNTYIYVDPSLIEKDAEDYEIWTKLRPNQPLGIQTVYDCGSIMHYEDLLDLFHGLTADCTKKMGISPHTQLTQLDKTAAIEAYGSPGVTNCSVSIDPPSASIPSNGTLTFQATFQDPAGNVASLTSFTWSTSDSTVAAVSCPSCVSASTIAQGVSPGVAQITASQADLDIQGSADVTVFDNQPPPNGNGCWSWNAQSNSWAWTCPSPPPPNGGASPPNGCWQWNAQALSWIAIQCGGGCVTSSGQPSALNFASCHPTGTHVEIIVAGDPNDKAGSQGIGQHQYVAANTALRYTIAFGNEKAASANACRVTITDPLDISNDDLITFSVGPISFGNHLLTPPAGAASFSTTVDLRPVQSLLVGVDARIDTNTNSAVWTLQCLDPRTHRPPTDTSLGFLPPGGEGSVFFTVMPKRDVPTNTSVQNQATVVFDKNPAISTPTWTNTLDGTPPTSQVSVLPADQDTSCFLVKWSGSDIGSGLASFTIFASDNGGSYAPWLRNTTATTEVFNGQPGHSYAFYGQATDLVGNVEAAKTSPEAMTTIESGATCNGRPTLTGSVVGNSLAGTADTVVLQFTNSGIGNAQNISLGQIDFRTIAGTGNVTLSSPSLPIGLGSLAAGASTSVTLTLNVPSTVKEFSMTEQGTLRDVSGKSYAFSVGQAVFP